MASWVPTIATFRRLIGRPVKDSVHSLLLVYAFSLGLDVEGGASIFIAGLQITLVGVAVCLDFLICSIGQQNVSQHFIFAVFISLKLT